MIKLFTIKYLGKTTLIMCAVLAVGHAAKMGHPFDFVVSVSSIAYCAGSVIYQDKLRAKKHANKNDKSV